MSQAKCLGENFYSQVNKKKPKAKVRRVRGGVGIKSITTISLEDAGNYTCNVTNVVGSSSNWTAIIFQGMFRYE